MSTLTVIPQTIKEARRWVAEHHSHLDAPVGGLAAVGVSDRGQLTCVAILSRPVSQALQKQKVAEVSRVASNESAQHAASKCLGAIRRAALELGYHRLVSYTLLGEAGTIYQANGWHVTALGKGGTWSRDKRKRLAPEQGGVKVRWETGPDAKGPSKLLACYVKEMVGKVVLRRRVVRRTQGLIFSAPSVRRRK